MIFVLKASKKKLVLASCTALLFLPMDCGLAPKGLSVTSPIFTNISLLFRQCYRHPRAYHLVPSVSPAGCCKTTDIWPVHTGLKLAHGDSCRLLARALAPIPQPQASSRYPWRTQAYPSAGPEPAIIMLSSFLFFRSSLWTSRILVSRLNVAIVVRHGCTENGRQL